MIWMFIIYLIQLVVTSDDEFNIHIFEEVRNVNFIITPSNKGR